MSVNYNKLWKMLIDKNLKKKDLQAAANLTSYAMYKLANNDNVTTEVLGKICKALHCTVDDIIDFIPEED